MWDYICPRCRREVSRNSHKCPYCGERFPFPVRVPPECLKDPKALEDYVHKHIFPRVSAWQRDYLAQFFTILFQSGFESGDFSEWTGTSGSPTIITDPVHHGNYAMKCDAVEYVYKTFSGQPVIYHRFYVRTNALPGSGQSLDFSRGVGANTQFGAGIGYSGGAKWQAQYRSGTAWMRINTDVPAQADTWYCVEIYWKYGSTDGEYKLYINGTLAYSITNIDTSQNGDCTQIRNGIITSGVSATVIQDCIVVADTYIGPEPSGQVYEISVDAVVKSSAEHSEQTTFNISKDAGVTSQSLHTPETIFNISQNANAQALATAVTEITFSLPLNAVVKANSLSTLESIFNISPTATVKVQAEAVIAKEGKIKVTRLFLIIGDLAIQIQGG